jgi:hypothetical protein
VLLAAYQEYAAGHHGLGGARPVPVLSYRLDLSRHHHEEHPMPSPPIRVVDLGPELPAEIDAAISGPAAQPTRSAP